MIRMHHVLRGGVFGFALILLSGCVGSYYSASNAAQEAKVHIGDAELYFGEKNYRAAEQSYGRAYALLRKAHSNCVTAPDCRLREDGLKSEIAHVLSMRAFCRLQLDDVRGADSDASLALEYAPHAPLGHFVMGLVHYQYGEYDQVRATITDLQRIGRNRAYAQATRDEALGYAEDLTRVLNSR